MKHSLSTSCEIQQLSNSSTTDKVANGEPHSSETAKDECSTKDDEDGKRTSLVQAVASSSTSSIQQPTSSAGSLQFYQGGKLVLKLQARKEEESYRWVKIKEWDPPQQPKRRKRYRKKLPKGRAKSKGDVFSSTDSEEESKVKAKPKSFLLHRFRASSLRHKDRQTPYKPRFNSLLNSNYKLAFDSHRQLQNGSPTHPSVSTNCMAEPNKVYGDNVPSVSSEHNSSISNVGGHSTAITTAITSSNSLMSSNALNNNYKNISTPSHIFNEYHHPDATRISSHNAQQASLYQHNNRNYSAASTNRISETSTIPSHKLSMTSSNPHQLAVNSMSRNNSLYPQLCSVPRQYLPSFSYPPIYQVPQFYYSNADAPLDLSVKTMKSP